MLASAPASSLQFSALKLSPNTPHKSPLHFPKYKPPKKIIIASHTTTAQNRGPQVLNREMATSASFYDVLGIPASASGHEIKAAYRKLARVCHPDVVSFNQKEMSANEFMKIHAAYSTLSDPDKRANYDRDLYRRKRPIDYSSLSSMSIFSGYSCRNWETDQCW